MALRTPPPRRDNGCGASYPCQTLVSAKLKPNIMNPPLGCLCAEKWNFRVHAQEDRFVEDKKNIVALH